MEEDVGGKASVRAALRDLVGQPGTRVMMANGGALVGTVEAVDRSYVWIRLPEGAISGGYQMVPIVEVAEVGTP